MYETIYETLCILEYKLRANKNAPPRRDQVAKLKF
jgi:hypothetical protein